MPAAYPHIICIASGKGGAGKTIVAANLSVALQQMGKRVVQGFARKPKALILKYKK